VATGSAVEKLGPGDRIQKGTGTACIEAPKGILLLGVCRPNHSGPEINTWQQYETHTYEIGRANQTLSQLKATEWRWMTGPLGGVDCPTEQYTGFCKGYTAPVPSYMSTGRNPSVFRDIGMIARILSLSKNVGQVPK